MKHNTARTGLVITFAAACVLSTAARAQAWSPPCSLAGVSGNYAFTDNGTVVGVGPRTAVGIATLHPDGKVTNGLATANLNGSVGTETLSGTYTVRSNCIGTMTVNIHDQSTGTLLFTATLSLSFDQKMEHMRALFTSITEPDGTPLQTVIGLDANKR